MNDLKSSTAVYPGISGNEIQWSGFRGAIANFGDQNREATILLSEGSGAIGSQKRLATIKLAPHDVSLMEQLNQLNGLNGNISLTITSDGGPGEVLSGIQGVQTPATSGATSLPWKDPAQSPNGGQHPWRTDLGVTSILTLYNPDAAQQASLPVTVYSNGNTWTREFTVGPLSTVAISLNSIVDGREPDAHGQTLPPGGSQGLVTWFTLAKPKVLGMMIQADPMPGAIRPFACAQTYALCSLSLPSQTVAVGATTGYISPITSTCGSNGDCACVESCGVGGSSLTSYSWSSSNSNIASLISNPSYASGNYQGNAGGSTYTDLSAYDNLGCFSSGTGPITVTTPQCFAQLKYRAVYVLDYYAGNHSFWWMQDANSVHWVADAGPGGTCPLCGYLVDWVMQGDTGHYADDNSNANLAWSSGVSSSVCTQVASLYSYAVHWPQTTYSYAMGSAPNSNTFSHWAGNAAGFSPTAPPNAPGW